MKRATLIAAGMIVVFLFPASVRGATANFAGKWNYANDSFGLSGVITLSQTGSILKGELPAGNRGVRRFNGTVNNQVCTGSWKDEKFGASGTFTLTLVNAKSIKGGYTHTQFGSKIIPIILTLITSGSPGNSGTGGTVSVRCFAGKWNYANDSFGLSGVITLSQTGSILKGELPAGNRGVRRFNGTVNNQVCTGSWKDEKFGASGTFTLTLVNAKSIEGSYTHPQFGSKIIPMILALRTAAKCK